ncbi:MAG: hypothetical protein COB41_01860 [Proteobacteria bacterium]|nr:MAG: hypothetical protein COB41_01860 [Pseudomonadota bacterium]
MPDIGMLELALIGIVAFLVIGPERLPSFFSEIAGFMRQGREWIQSIKQQFDAEKQQLIQPLNTIKEELNSSVEDIKEDLIPKKETKLEPTD